MIYVVKEGVSSLYNKFLIHNADGDVAFTVETQAYLAMYYTYIKNHFGNIVAVIRPNLNIFSPIYSFYAIHMNYIQDENDPFMKIRSFFKCVYDIKIRNGKNLMVTYRSSDRSYKITQGNREVASITWPFFWGINKMHVHNEEYELICVIIMATIIRYYHDDRSTIFQSEHRRLP